MRRKLLLTSIVMAVAFAFVATAGEKAVTMEGSMACAKCTLKLADAKECQTVVQVKNDKGEDVNYYIVKNDVAEKFGHVCQGMKTVKITGTVMEKEGKKWIEATKIEEVKKA